MELRRKLFGFFLLTLFIATITLPRAQGATFSTVKIHWEGHQTHDSHDAFYDDTDEVYMRVEIDGIVKTTSGEITVDEDDDWVSEISESIVFEDVNEGADIEVDFYDADESTDDELIVSMQFDADGNYDTQTDTDVINNGESTAEAWVSYPSGSSCPPIC